MVDINKKYPHYNKIVNQEIIRKSIKATLETEDEEPENIEVSVLLTDDEAIRKLNRTYRNVDSATDVLAFAMREGEFALNPSVLGDIVISVDTAERQAEEVEHSLQNELALLAVHGTLHLLGYDDQKESEAKIMHEKERKILSEVIDDC